MMHRFKFELILTVLLLLAPGLAQAEVIGSGQITVNISGSDGLSIDLVTGDTGNSTAPGSWDAYISSSIILQTNPSNSSAGFATRVGGIGGINNLPLGFAMSNSVPLIPSGGPTNGAANYNWDFPGDSNYVGIYFYNEATAQYHFGWIRFCFSGNLFDQPRALVEYGYESVPQTPITIGAGGSGLPSDCGGGGGCQTEVACALADDILPNGSNCLELNATDTCDTLTFRLGNIDYTDPGKEIWENVTWQGPAGQRVDASLGFIPPLVGPVDITMRTLTLRDVDLSPNRFGFRFEGDTLSVSLEDATWSVEEPDPVFIGGSPLFFQSTGDSNVVFDLEGIVDSPTTLTVGNGNYLQFLGCGKTGSGQTPASRCNFANTANHADIDGGIFDLQISHVLFGTADGEMLVHNGGQILLNGSDTTLETQNLRVEGGSVQMGPGFTKMLHEDLTLNNGTIDLALNAQITASIMHVFGTSNTVSLSIQGDLSAKALTLAVISMEGPGSVLTLAGEGLATTGNLVFFTNDAIVRLTELSGLHVGPGGQTWTGGAIEIGPTSLLQISPAANVSSEASIQNDGVFRVLGQFKPVQGTTMAGTGILQVMEDGILGPLGGAGSGDEYTVDPPIVLESQSRLQLVLRPEIGQNQKIIANSTFAISNLSGAYLDLIVAPETDAEAPEGTKFAIIDYPSQGDFTGHFLRSDGTPLLSGDEITVGLNTYRIEYFDPDYDPANPSVVTLTVIEGPVATFLTRMDVEAESGGNSLEWVVNGSAEPGQFSVFREENRSGRFDELTGAIIARTGEEFRFVDGDARPGSTYRYRVNTSVGGQSTVLFTTDFVSVPGFQFALEQNHPNPFNPSTTIAFTLAEDSSVSLRIYNVAGRLVKDLIPNQGLPAGKREITWDGTDGQGKSVPAGVYFYVLDAGSFQSTKRMALVK